MFKHWFTRPKEEAAAAALYRAVVTQARQPVFYASLGVPDTVDGRFELIALHAFLVLRRLKGEGEKAALLGQSLFDVMFADLDRNLRELGAGDLGVGPRVKAMGKAFYGRIAAYDAGLSSSDGELDQALRRNLYGTHPDIAMEPVAVVAAYARRQADLLANCSIDALMRGEFEFGSPPLAPA